jgi:hypothetical protein
VLVTVMAGKAFSEAASCAAIAPEKSESTAVAMMVLQCRFIVFLSCH